ncbi:Stage II sporulation protein AC [uncultured Roseburia sp.]|uniref:RNA polymerase sigma factor n=1 Tax=Brotonthovivens ammoniilytica TaxID=2981725 RepID=A0ABT2TJX8_9FIRM|nr:SigB/SigF/SigG family RNA polymerase sigma factor [Brotonthovivens ammoniilytica]MCU6762456.1 SigB/SigF/SigG family RNA polymerase sigma factor [Brotonthovivens ammoniilytica]SCI72287.1 Stage II sporulation protein AC [uncultured Roseburia sp.]
MTRTAQLIEQSRQGDKNARDTLVEENMGLVWSIVHRFANRGYEMEDLFQIGSIGLMKAIDRFDTSFEVKFSTYAVPMITGEIKRFLRDDGMIKVSRTLKENNWKIVQAMQRLQNEKGRDITIQELSEETGLETEDIVMAMEANTEIDSLNKPMNVQDGKEIFLEDQLSAARDEKESVDNRLLLEQLLGQLNVKERQLIYMRYFQDRTQSDVAKVLHMTQVQVSRLEKKLLNRMRQLAETGV